MSRSLILLALLVATTSAVNVNFYASSSTCSGTATFTASVALDTCSCYAASDGATCAAYQKVTLSGSTYSWGYYTDNTCGTSAAACSTCWNDTYATTASAAVDRCDSWNRTDIKFATSDVSTTVIFNH